MKAGRALVGAVWLAMGSCGFAAEFTLGATQGQVYPYGSATRGVGADNSGINRRDDGSTRTPIDQGMGSVDTGITQAVRSAITSDGNLSMDAHNVKIITKEREVTLRGPVASEAERTTIVRLARSAANVLTVHDQLDILAR